MKQLCSLEQTLCSTKLPSGGELTLDELLRMVQRMLVEMTLGEQERLRLLLITLFSYPSLAESEQWSALVQAARLTNEEYQKAITNAM